MTSLDAPMDAEGRCDRSRMSRGYLHNLRWTSEMGGLRLSGVAVGVQEAALARMHRRESGKRNERSK